MVFEPHARARSEAKKEKRQSGKSGHSGKSNWPKRDAARLVKFRVRKHRIRIFDGKRVSPPHLFCNPELEKNGSAQWHSNVVDFHDFAVELLDLQNRNVVEFHDFASGGHGNFHSHRVPLADGQVRGDVPRVEARWAEI